MEKTMPKIIVKNDYDGFFENLVRGWCERKEGPFKNDEITISAGPYRPYAMDYEKTGERTIHFDFYSAFRVGFGSLSESEILQIIELL